MRISTSLRWVFSIATFVGLTVFSFAQDDLLALPKDENQVVRNPKAIILVQSAVAALGGPAISQVQDCIAQGTSQVHIGGARPAESLTIENAGTEYRYAGASGDVIVSGHGNPVAQDHNGKRTTLSRRTAWGNLSPHLVALYLYAELNDQRYTLLDGGSTVVHGRPALVVMAKHPTGVAKHQHDSVTAQKWLFDAATHIPLKVEYIVPGARDGVADAVRSVELSNYAQVSGVLVPMQSSYYMYGKLEAVTTLTSVRFNTGLSPSEFEISGGGR